MFPIPISSIRGLSNMTSTERCVLQRINFSEATASKFRVLNPLADRLLHKFTEQSPTWEADTFSASQEVALILFQPNVKGRVHSSQPPVPVLRQINPVHAPPSYFFKVHLYIILSNRLTSSKWPLSFMFPLQNPVCIFLVPRACYMSRPSHVLDFITLIIFGELGSSVMLQY
jgi:hypothetical protein